MQRYIGSMPASEGTSPLIEALSLVDSFLDAKVRRNGGGSFVLARYIDADAAELARGYLTRARGGELDAALLADTALDLVRWVGYCIASMRENLSRGSLTTLDPLLGRYDDRVQFHLALNSVRRVGSDVQEQRAEAEDAARQAAESATNATELVGDAAASKLGAEFAQYSGEERRRSSLWSILAISVLVAVAGASVATLVRLPSKSVAEVVARFAATLPLIGVGVYAARVAGHHRATAHWARTHAVQLTTIGAYSDLLPQDKRHELRLEVGRSVFAPGGPADLPDSASPALVDPATVLRHASEVLRSSADVLKSVR